MVAGAQLNARGSSYWIKEVSILHWVRHLVLRSGSCRAGDKTGGPEFMTVFSVEEADLSDFRCARSLDIVREEIGSQVQRSCRDDRVVH